MRGWIYDTTMRTLTSRWYREVLGRLAPGTKLLDIGIGTAGPLLKNADLLVERGLRVVGVDIDRDYVRRARARIAKEGLSDRIDVRLESILDHEDGPYDAAYFAASFMLMPDPPGVLAHVGRLLGPRGLVYFTQTFQEKMSPLVEKAKPLLKTVTTIDFGQVTYERDFLDALSASGCELLEMSTMSYSRDRSRTYRIAVGRPRRSV